MFKVETCETEIFLFESNNEWKRRYNSKSNQNSHQCCSQGLMARGQGLVNWTSKIRDVPDIRYRLAGYPAIFSNPAPVPAKTVPSTGYLSPIVLGPSWQLVELSSPSKWLPYCKHVHLNFKN